MGNFLSLVMEEDKTVDNFLNRVKEHETVRGFMELQHKNKAVRISVNILLLVVYAFAAARLGKILLDGVFFMLSGNAAALNSLATTEELVMKMLAPVLTFICVFAVFCVGRYFYRRRWFLIAALVLLLIVPGKISTTVLMLILVPITVCIGLYFYRQKWLWIFPLAFAPALMYSSGDDPFGILQYALPVLLVFWALYALAIFGVYGVDARMTRSTHLIKLVQQGKRDLVAASLQRGANANVTDDTGAPVLVQALGDMGIFKLLLEHGADASAAIKFANAEGKPALAQALGEMEIFKLMLEHDADVNAADETGKTALIRAIEMKNIEAVKLLLDKGADINAVNGSGKTALIRAVEVGSVEAAGLLLDKGSDANSADDKGVPALMLALKNMDMFKLLLEKGADINAADAQGQTPLVSAMKAKNVKAASLLLELGANLDVARDGSELLALAAQNNDMELARRLVGMGVNPQTASQGA